VAYLNPSVADFKARFSRDFAYGATPAVVMDSDIAIAFVDVNNEINPALWESQEVYNSAYLFLSAHFLSVNIRASSQGLQGQGLSGVRTSRGVGPVSEGFTPAQRIVDNPTLAGYQQTQYGDRYLKMVMPRLTGACLSVPGATQP
jgi:hypothetical protein